MRFRQTIVEAPGHFGQCDARFRKGLNSTTGATIFLSSLFPLLSFPHQVYFYGQVFYFAVGLVSYPNFGSECS